MLLTYFVHNVVYDLASLLEVSGVDTLVVAIVLIAVLMANGKVSTAHCTV